jgi:lipopolysaccharide transport system permease protein
VATVNKVNNFKKEAGAVVSPVIKIRPLRGWVGIDFAELWTYRELLYFLTWRDIKVRYKQTVIGFAWAILQPLLMTLIFTLFFGILAAIPSQGVPYVLFTFTALVPWTLFASGVTRASNSLIYDAALIQKVYFPRLLLPLAGILSPLLDFFFAFVVLIGMMLFYGYAPGLAMLALVPFLLLTLMFTMGIGLWLSAINVEYRDVGQLVPFLVQLLFFASPVIYPSSFVPARFQAAYGLLNPMAGVIEGFRWALLGTEPPGLMILASAGIIILILVSGALYFRYREKAFADVV